MSKYTQYTSEFKIEAVKLAQSSDKPISTIANELGVKSNTLYNWISLAMKNNILKTSKSSKPNYRYQELEKENLHLRRELKRAKQEREILKKAAAYFASQEL